MTDRDTAAAKGPETYYAMALGPVAPAGPLEGDESADVCVVGGGLTGVTAALELAECGCSVVLLEARRIGWGASGRNGGQGHLGFGPRMAPLKRMLGLGAARALWRSTLDGVDDIERRIARHDIDCGLRHGLVEVATRRRSLTAFARWVDEAARDYGFKGYSMLDRAAVRAQVASPLYCGGLHDARSIHLQPLAYLRGLAAVARASGVRIHEASAAREIRVSTRSTVATDRGLVRAEHVVIAGNAYLSGVCDELHDRMTPVSTFIGASAPLGAETARALIPNDVMVCDDRRAIDYFRLTADHRLLFGGGHDFLNRVPGDIAGRLRRRVSHVFPQLSGVDLTHVWAGSVSSTRAQLPDTGRLAPTLYYVQGYSGQGLVLSNVIARAIADAITGRGELFDLFSRIRHKPFPRRPAVRALALRAMGTWLRISDAF